MGSRALKRGDVILFATGKPRPGVIVQANGIETPVEILVCPLSTTPVDASYYRPAVEPTAQNGLKRTSYVMTDKVGPVPRSRVGDVIGRMDTAAMLSLDIALATMLDLAAL